MHMVAQDAAGGSFWGQGKRVQLWKSRAQRMTGCCVLLSHCLKMDTVQLCSFTTQFIHHKSSGLILRWLISCLLVAFTSQDFIFSQQMWSELGRPVTKVFPNSDLVGSGAFCCGVTRCRFSFTKCTWLLPELHHIMLHGQLDGSSVMVEVMTPCACVGGAERADEWVVVCNCTECDCMLRFSTGWYLYGCTKSCASCWGLGR